MEKFKVHVVQNRLIQISKNEKGKIIKHDDYYICPAYNIYINGKRFSNSSFRFYFDLEIEAILNAKSFRIKNR